MGQAFKNSGEGGTNGTAVSPANSGGASGDAFTNVVIGTGEALTYDNTHVAHGSLAYKAVTDGSHQSNVYWEFSDSSVQQWFRVNLYASSNVNSGSSVSVIESRTTGGASRCAYFVLNSSGKFEILNSLNTILGTLVNPIPLNQYFRIEGYVIGNSSTGAVEFKLFQNVDDVTPLETQTFTNTNTAGTPVRYTFGQPNQPVGGWTVWMDDLAVSSFGYLGPVVSPTATLAGVLVSPTWSNQFLPEKLAKQPVLFDYQLTFAGVYSNPGGDLTFGAISSGYQSLISPAPFSVQGSPAWENQFLPEKLAKQAVLFDYQLTFSASYSNGAGDVAFSAISLGVSIIPGFAPSQANPGPAWRGRFGRHSAQSQPIILYDEAFLAFSGLYNNPSGDIVFGAISVGYQSLVSPVPYSIQSSPAWENQFLPEKLAKQAVLFDYQLTFSGSPALGINFGATVFGFISAPVTPPVKPGPAWLNFFSGHLRKQSVYYDGITYPAPFGPFCFSGTEADTNAFGGTQSDENLYGGSATDANLYGGTAYAGCFVNMQAVNITLGEFNDETINLTITNNGSPFNLGGYGLQALFKTSAGVQDTDSSTLVLSTLNGGITITSNVNGTATLVIPHADLQNTNFSFWRVDVTINGTQATAIYGTVTMRAL